MFNKTKKGFSLTELILVLAAITISTISVFFAYSIYDKNTRISILSQSLQEIERGVLNTFSASSNTDQLNNSFLIDTGFIPQDMISGNKIITSLDNEVTVKGVNTNTFSISLSKVDIGECALIANTEFFRYNADKIIINNITVKDSGLFTGDNNVNIISACDKSKDNLVVAEVPVRGLVYHDPNEGAGTTTPLRNKIEAKYIPKISSTSTTLSCSGGSVWKINHCSCPNNTAWNGNSCQAFNTRSPQDGWCKPGEAFAPNTKTCTPISGANSSYKFSNNTYIPSVINVDRLQTNNKSITNSLPKAGSEIIAGKTISWGVGNKDGNIVQVCVNGTWNVTTKSCLTP